MSRAEKLQQINEKERRNNEAFKKWICNDACFPGLSKSNREDLILYVEALNREIADLESSRVGIDGV